MIDFDYEKAVNEYIENSVPIISGAEILHLKTKIMEEIRETPDPERFCKLVELAVQVSKL